MHFDQHCYRLFNALFYSDYKPLCLQALLTPLMKMCKPGAHKWQITDYAKVLSFYLNGDTLKFIKFVRLETLVVSSVFVNLVLHILISVLQEKSGSFTESICARYVSNNK